MDFPKITEYKVFMEKSPAELSTTITAKISEGWYPIGGVFITQNPIPIQHGQFTVVETHSHQAMVKLKVF